MDESNVQRISFLLAREERDLLLGPETKFVDTVLRDLLRFGVVEGTRLRFVWSLDDFEFLIDAAAAEAHAALQGKERRFFERLYHRLNRILDANLSTKPWSIASEKSALPHDVREAIQELLDSGKGQSIDDINAALEDIRDRHNRTPQPILGGFSPDQMRGLLHDEWDEPQSTIRLNHALPLEDVETTPYFDMGRMLLNVIVEQGGVRATKAGNLSQAVVMHICKAKEWPACVRGMIPKYKTKLREEDLRSLHYLRIMLELSDCIKQRKGRFVPTGKGRRLAEPGNAGDFYAELFKTHFREFNLDYVDGMPECSIVQLMAGYAFLGLQRHANVWVSAPEITPFLFTAHAIRDMEKAAGKASAAERYATLRILRPLLCFGLLEMQAEEDDWILAIDRCRYRKSPLFDRFLSFHLKA